MFVPPRVRPAVLLIAIVCSSLFLMGAVFVRADTDGSAAKPADFGTTSRPGVVRRAGPTTSANPVTAPRGPAETNGAQTVLTGTIPTITICAFPTIQSAHALTRDGGGSITVWQDERNAQKDLYAQRLNSGGFPVWAVGGLPVCKAAGEQLSPKLISDGAGGAIVVWEDLRSDAGDIYAQRINALGILLWTTTGVPICTAPNRQSEPVIVSDGMGGAILAWMDSRIGGRYVYVQRINASGVVQWTPNGVPLSQEDGPRQGLSIVSDGQQGAIIAWQDGRSFDGGDIYAGRMSGDGTPLWTVNGVPLCVATGTQEAPSAVTDGAGGAIVAWRDSRTLVSDIYAQRVSAAGAVAWTADGVVVSAASGAQDAPAAAEDGAGGAIVTWVDGRGANRDIYAQRMDGTGTAQWTADGEPLCTASADQSEVQIAADPLGGAVVVWSDLRTPASLSDVYAQHVDLAGALQWTANGVQLCDAVDTQDEPEVVADGLGGATIVWRDLRTGGTPDIYGQRVDGSGTIPSQCPEPDTIAASYTPYVLNGVQNYRTFNQPYFYWAGVAVAGATGDWDLEVYDQGGELLTPYPTCFGFPLAGSYRTTGVDFVMGDFNDLATPPGRYGVRGYRVSGTGSGLIDWDTLEEDLVVNAAPLSSPANWTGLIDVYDADVNTTTGLSAGVTYWFEMVNDNPAADLKLMIFSSYGHIGTDDYYYVVPRSSRVIENTNRWTQFTPPAYGFYGVVVVNDNQVPTHYTLRSTTTAPTGIGESPRETGLKSVSPNPSAGRVQFGFALREPGTVSFEVLDMAGRVVSRIPERQWEAGTWNAGWDGHSAQGDEAPPGIYFVQMRVNGKPSGHSRLALIR